MGPRGDAIDQAEWQVGEILRTLDESSLTNNTLVIFTSDNGPVVDDGYKDEKTTPSPNSANPPPGAITGFCMQRGSPCVRATGNSFLR